MWVIGGFSDTGTMETIETGWIKRPGSNSRLFVFFTPDNYGSGSCWNTDCGFVQTNTSVVLNGTFTSYSVSGGTQQEAGLVIMKDGANGNWWFGFGTTWVGYWPRTLFDTSGLFTNGIVADFGGEVFDYTGASHTTADMGGDGSFAASGYGHSAYQHLIQYFEKNTLSLLDVAPGAGGVVAEKPGCYDILYGHDGAGHPHIFFGGPGYNASNCPL